MSRKNDDQKPGIPAAEFIAQNAEAGNYHLIDIAAERGKGTFVSQEQFAERLSKYTLDDYFHTEKPYCDLLECSRGQAGLYDQLSYVLLDMAKRQMHAKDSSLYERDIAAEIAFYKQVHLPDLSEAISILDMIDKVEADPETADMVSVLPLLCGSGKTSAITLKIKEVLERKDGTGMLVVTDSNDRLDEIWTENENNPLLGDEVNRFIRENKNKVTIMKRDNYIAAQSSQKKTPVLAMTTQRFFNVLTKKEIESYLTWGRGKRTLILFDEEPYLNELRDVNVKTVNDLHTLLWCVLDDDPIEDKRWCIEQWEMFRDRFCLQLWRYEHDHKGDVFFHQEAVHSLTEDDERFFSIIHRNIAHIRSASVNYLKDIYACKALVDNWGIYSYRTEEYDSKFTVYLDNSNKVRGLPAKVVVLDGTARVSPRYLGQEHYIDMRSEEVFLRSLSHLHIFLGDISTSKAEFDRNIRLSGTITSYLQSLGYNRENAYLFTYMEKENRFSDAFRTAHFGKIKGQNIYQDADCIAQVGLNELQPAYYLTHMLAIHDELRSRLEGLSPEESAEQIKQIMKETHDCAQIKNAHILADIEQNMFRSAVRTARNRKDVAFYLFYEDKHMPDIKKKMRDRFCTKMGGSLKRIMNSTIDKYKPKEELTNEEKVYLWYQQWTGEPKKWKTIAEETELSASVLRTVVYRSDLLGPLFGKARESGYEITKKSGWYAKERT